MHDNDPIRGGQGRESADLRRDAAVLFWLLVSVAVAAMALAVCAG